MGGTSYIIKGVLDQSRLDPLPRRKTLVDRLLCRQRYDTPTYSEMGQRTLIEVPPGSLPKQLLREFKRFLGDRMPNPWGATKTFLDSYLTSGSRDVYLRGEKMNGEEEVDWFVQLRFSSGAGAVETSSQLAYHWADIWLRSEIQNVNDTILKPEGFTASCEFESVDVPFRFVPVGNERFSIYAEATHCDDEPGFEIDGWLLESREDGGKSLVAEIREELGELMADGKCRCQLCAPDYMPAQTIAL